MYFQYEWENIHVIGATRADHIAAVYRLISPQLQWLFKEKLCIIEKSQNNILMHLGSDSLVPASHLAVSSQLHSLQPDHHLLGTDASRRVPLTPSFQLHIPDEHKTFKGLSLYQASVRAPHSHRTAQACSGLLPLPQRKNLGPYLIRGRHLSFCLSTVCVLNPCISHWSFCFLT